MSAESFRERLAQNVPGKFYVDEQCLVCALCLETAPTTFQKDDAEGVAYVAKQPETAEELELARKAIEQCPCEAIFDDGDEFDWSEPQSPRPEWREDDHPKPSCGHCGRDKKPWWKFWG